MAESERPRIPRPAATGIASANSPISSARVTPSISATALAFGAFLQVADLVLDLFLGRACADGPRCTSEIATHDHAKGIKEEKNSDDHESQQTDDPQRLRDHGRRFQRRLAARARGPRLRHDAEA